VQAGGSEGRLDQCAPIPGRSRVWALDADGRARPVARYDEFFAGGPGPVPGWEDVWVLLRPAAPGTDSPSAYAVLAGPERVERSLHRLGNVGDLHWVSRGKDRGVLLTVAGGTLWRLDVDGNLRALVEDESMYGAELLPDGRVVALRAGESDALDLACFDRGSWEVLASRVGALPPEPEMWSRALVPLRLRPDTWEVSFPSLPESGGDRANVVTYDIRTGGRRAFEVERVWSLSWSPDGCHLAVVPAGIYSADGEPVAPLPEGTLTARWSPDGRMVLTDGGLVVIATGCKVDPSLPVSSPKDAILRPLGWWTAPSGELEALVMVSVMTQP